MSLVTLKSSQPAIGLDRAVAHVISSTFGNAVLDLADHGSRPPA